MNIYVASSWRNQLQPQIVEDLRSFGHTVYDFRNTKEGGGAFNWDAIDPRWEHWNNAQFLEALYHPLAVEAFENDIDALQRADAVVMVMPCGDSSHLELGYAVGVGKHTAILLDNGRAELMHKSADLITPYMLEIVQWLKRLEAANVT